MGKFPIVVGDPDIINAIRDNITEHVAVDDIIQRSNTYGSTTLLSTMFLITDLLKEYIEPSMGEYILIKNVFTQYIGTCTRSKLTPEVSTQISLTKCFKKHLKVELRSINGVKESILFNPG